MRPIALTLCLLLLSAAAPQEEVPAPLALTLMLKVLTYDGEFARHGQGDFVVLVPGDAESTRAVLDAVEQLEHKAILGRRLTFVPIAPAEVEKKTAELKA